MERHGLAVEEGSRSEWTNQTGIEASMWRLGLQGGGGESYPERSNEPDCMYYIRTGFCGYGSRCRFNHPRDRAPVLGGLGNEAGELPERLGQPVCKHFLRTGTCKFGATCKYHHPRLGGVGGYSVTPTSLNNMGCPLRPGEKECSYYMRTGQCKFGSTCRFHHPDSPGVHAPPGVAIPRPGTYAQSPYSYSQMVLPPTMVPYSGWNPYQASGNPVSSLGTQPSIGSRSIYGITPLSSSAPAFQSGPSSNNEQSFPQRPGEPECQYFLRTGDCEFGSSCRFHHPLEAASPKAITISQIGLPLRPGTAQCTHFMQHGTCKFGLACKFDHSMPVTPYTLGSSSPSTDTKLKTTTSGGSETVAAEVSSSMTSGVSHSESAETKNGDSASIEAKTSF